MDLKRTENFEDHIRLGAKMVPFAGYEMPVQYKGISLEHTAVRNAAGMFDVSHMGEFIVKGPHALELIQLMSTNDASLLKEGQAQYSSITNKEGRLLDDMLVYRLGPDAFMLVVNASNIEKDWNWMVGLNTMGAEIHNISDKTALLAIQGPKALEILQKVTSLDLKEIPYYHFKRGELNGIPNVLFSNTGYTGAGGMELYFENNHARTIWNKILEAGKEEGIEPAGLGARDTLRLEMGFCLYGNDIDESTHPLEAGLGWITKFTKAFSGSEILQEIKKNGLKRKLIGFEMVGNAIPRGHYPIKSEKGETLGEVTSGTQSPSLKKGIGMGYVSLPYLETGKNIFIEIRGSLHEAQPVKFPFLKK